MLEIWLPLLSIAVIIAWWYHALKLRERAVAHARALCERHGLQLLDDSVALHRLRMDWRHGGGLRVMREYRFDTSLGGNDRRAASITLLGDRIVSESVPERDVPFHEPVSAVHVVHDVPPTEASVDAGNVVPITRARRTLH